MTNSKAQAEWEDGIREIIDKFFQVDGREHHILHLENDLIDLFRKILSAQRAEIVKMVRGMKREITLEEPRLRQYEARGSAPFFCTLCSMSELNIMENKTKDNKYFCGCSYWSDPHNAFLDRSGGKWLGWINKLKAQELVEQQPCEDNFYNSALDALAEKIERGE